LWITLWIKRGNSPQHLVDQGVRTERVEFEPYGLTPARLLRSLGPRQGSVHAIAIRWPSHQSLEVLDHQTFGLCATIRRRPVDSKPTLKSEDLLTTAMRSGVGNERGRVS
jgi:hypothetical protein